MFIWKKKLKQVFFKLFGNALNVKLIHTTTVNRSDIKV